MVMTDISLDTINERLKEKILKRLPQQDLIETPIDGVMLGRKNTTERTENCFYQPTVALVIQGTKYSRIGQTEYCYSAGQYMVAGVDMPSTNYMADASPDTPFLAISIKLDRYLIAQLMAEIAVKPMKGHSILKSDSDVVIVEKASYELLDAFWRLVELFDNPARIPVLAPMILREIHYLLLTGSQGEKLRTICTLGTNTNRIAQAINWLRDNYRKSFSIDEIANHVHMAPSSFHRHFRRITTLSPLQFQKRLRLYEAERLMLLENKDAITAALEVGYESGTQFNREYKRQFGEPPFRDINKKRILGE